MPNHIHFILEQKTDKGIQMYLSHLQNAYTRYFNVKNQTKGQLFDPQFKAVLIEDDSQLLHTVRYVLLNPYTAHITKTFDDLLNYPWSSISEYFNYPSVINLPITHTTEYMKFFKDTADLRRYLEDEADYQRELARIKHLLLE